MGEDKLKKRKKRLRKMTQITNIRLKRRSIELIKQEGKRRLLRKRR